MRFLRTIVVVALVGFLLIGLAYNDLFVVLRDYNRVRGHVFTVAAVSIPVGFLIELLRD
jgi:ABC-type polysaccharide/polyol phosphate export permease